MNKNTIRFSIILPTHNRRDLLENAINSVLQQSFKDWELIIVNDGSTDTTKEFLDQLQDSRISILHQDHSERSMARNLGIKTSKNAFICFLDDDDTYEPGFLSTFETYLKSKPENQTILRIGYRIVEKSDIRKSKLFDVNKHINPVRFAAFHMCGVWSLCIPAAFLKSDNFHESYPHWQDTHLILRLLAKYPFHQLNSYQYNYHIHEEMGSKALFQNGEILMRTELSIAAIEDLFEYKGHLVGPFLPDYTKEFLVQQKVYRGLDLLSKDNRKEDLKKLSRRINFVRPLWKSYIKYKMRYGIL